MAKETGAPRIQVLVADNGDMQSKLLAEALKRDAGLEVFAVSRSQDLTEIASQRNLDVALISSFLDEEPMRGIELARSLRAMQPHTRCVILLESSKRELILEAFRAGARGVFSRHESLDNLRTCVRQVHSGQIWADADQMGYAVEALASAPKVRAVDAEGINLLSKREMEVVRALAEGLTNREIGARLGLSPHTVKNYLFRVFDKLGVSNRMELLAFTLTPPVSGRALSLSRPDLAPARGLAMAEDAIKCKYAAERGDYAAQLNLAEMYWSGIGLEQDSLLAYSWYLVAEKTHSEMKARIQLAMRRIVETLSTDEVLETQRIAAEQFALSCQEVRKPTMERPRGGAAERAE